MILINYTCFLINIHLIIKNETRKKTREDRQHSFGFRQFHFTLIELKTKINAQSFSFALCIGNI